MTTNTGLTYQSRLNRHLLLARLENLAIAYSITMFR